MSHHRNNVLLEFLWSSFDKSISVLWDINCSFLIQGPQYLGYLTSEQALADFAVLIRHLKVNI